MKKEAQLAVLVLVMLAGLYGVDYFSNPGISWVTFTGAVTSIDSIGSASMEPCEVNTKQGKVTCKSGNPKTDYGNQLGECNSNCKPAAAGTTGTATKICGNSVGESSNNEQCDWGNDNDVWKDHQRYCDDGTVAKGKYTCTSSCTFAYDMPGGCPEDEIAIVTADEIASVTAVPPKIGSFFAAPKAIAKGDKTVIAWTGIESAEVCEILADGTRIKTPNNGYITTAEFISGTRTLAPEKTTDYQIRCHQVIGAKLSSTDSNKITITVGGTQASSGASGSISENPLCEVTKVDGKVTNVLCKSGNPKLGYGTQVGECTVYCKPAVAGTTGGTQSGSSGSASQEVCEVNTAQGKVTCKSGNPKTDYGNQLGECNSNCKPAAAGTTGTASPGAAASSEEANLVVGGVGLGRDANVVLSISNLGKKKVSNPLAVAASIKKDGVVVCTGEGYFSSSLDVGKSAAVVASMKGNTGASCSLQEGDGYMVEATVDSKGWIPETNENDNTYNSVPLTFLTASSSGFTCTAYTVGFRTQDGRYCDASGNAVAQKAGGQSCYNSFECSSNFCGAGQCIETSVLKKTFCAYGATSLC